jgi:hypothetical protein
VKPNLLIRLAPVLLIAWLAAGCAYPAVGGSPRELFAHIAVGMPRAKVDALLGPPTVPPSSPEEEAWYLPPPQLRPEESPFAPGTIGIHFTKDGRVASKRLNPQFRDR